jgi:WD40 repeat protein/serine/threonine protein kinase
MSSGILCRDCGKAIPGDSPGGFCAQCLLNLGLRAEGDRQDLMGGSPSTPVEEEGISQTQSAAIAGFVESTVDMIAPLTEKAGDRIGRYRLLQEIGHGGCGVVYMAEQEEPVQRRVALKVIKLGMDTRQVVARFEAERQALALMEHPNIAKVLDAGATEAGRPYFVMELVRGIRITDYCDQNKLPTGDRLKLFIQVCQAIQHAHQKGIIHRDIKPSNILVTLHDGVPVPKVIDFGIAKATQGKLTDQTLFTAFEQFIGTPAYMSPEQAEMSGLDIDTRSDIYSLGVLLYELLVGTTPFEAKQLLSAGLDEMRRRIREQDPVRPSTRLSTMLEGELTTTAQHRQTDAPKLIHLIRGDLDWIVMKCLEKDRTRRYETANGLGADIQRHLNNEPVVARPPSSAYRFQKLVRRNKLAFAAAAAIGVVLLLGIAVSTWQAVRATTAMQTAVKAQQKETEQRQVADLARQHETQERQRAEGYATDLHQTLYVSDTAVAWQSWAEGDAERARERLERYRPTATQTNDLRGFEWRYLWGLSRPDELSAITNSCVAAKYSPDGRTLAISDGTGIIKLWDPIAQKEVRSFRAYPNHSWRISFSPDSRVLATVARGDPDVKLWDVQTCELLGTLAATNQEPFSAVFSPDGKRIATVACTPVSTNIPPILKVWEATSHRELFELTGHRFWVPNLDFSPDSKILATPDGEGLVKLWDLESRKEIRSLAGHSGIAFSVTFSPVGQILATADQRGTIILWNWATGNVLRVLTGHRSLIYDLAISRDGKLLASAGQDHTARIWDLEKGEQVARFLGHFGRVWTVDFSPDGQTLVTASLDNTVRFWRVAAKRESDVSRPNGPVGFCPDGRFLFEDDRRKEEIALKDPISLAVVRTLPGKDIKFTGDGKSFVVVRNKTDIVVCATDSLHEIKTIKGNSNISVREFSPNGRFVVFERAERVLVLDLDQMREVADLGSTVQRHLFIPDSKHLVVANSSDTLIHVWDVDTWKISSKLAGHAAKVISLAISPDGKTLASGSDDTTVRLWDMNTCGPAANPVLRGNAGPINEVAFSRDGRTLAAGGFDGPIELWSVSGRQQFGALKGHLSWFFHLEFSPDDRTLLSSSYDGTMRLWRAPGFDETDAAQHASK